MKVSMVREAAADLPVSSRFCRSACLSVMLMRSAEMVLGSGTIATAGQLTLMT